MSEKLIPGTLCVVCDDVATGNHYSVASCNGCKTFFRRALVNNRQFECQGNGNCPVNKGVRCACRHCRLQKCLSVGMDRNSIQSARDRIGYTKRTRKSDKLNNSATTADRNIDFDDGAADDEHTGSPDAYALDPEHAHSPIDIKDIKYDNGTIDPILERLTTLENNLTLLLSRGDIEPYASLDDALAAPSRFNCPIHVKIQDPIAQPRAGKGHLPFWRSRMIALYIDWAKTFSCFRNLPNADKVALITNHASSYMIMCEAFRTHEDIDEGTLENCMSRVRAAPESASNVLTVVLREAVAQSFASTLEIKTKVKMEPSDEMIRLPTEYGSLPADYGTWIPQDYGHPVAGTEGRSDMHMFFESRGTENGENGDTPIRPDPINGMNYSIPGENGDIAVLNPICHAIFPSPLFRTCDNESRPAAEDLSSLTPVMAAMIDYVMKPFRQLNVSTTEFATMQAIMFFDPDTDGIDSASQRNIAAEQKRLLAALHKYITRSYIAHEADERFSNILLRIPTIRKVAAKKNESLQMIDMLKLFSLNSLVRETALGVRTPTIPTPVPTGCQRSSEYPAECTE